MDALRRDDVEQARTTSPAEKLLQAIELAQLGYAIQWSKLRQRHPTESEAEIRARLIDWIGRV
jgi:hypothetical protein